MSCARCKRNSVPPLQGGTCGGRGKGASAPTAPADPTASALNLLGEDGGGAAAAASAMTAAEQRESIALRRTSLGILKSYRKMGAEGGGGRMREQGRSVETTEGAGLIILTDLVLDANRGVDIAPAPPIPKIFDCDKGSMT